MVDRLAGGARALQHLDNVVVMTLARDLHWRLTMVVGLGLVGTRLDQQSHDLEVTFLASDIQRRITILPFRLKDNIASLWMEYFIFIKLN